MSHDPHTPGVIFEQRCAECLDRVSNLPESLGSLDRLALMRAWSLMVDEKWGGGRAGGARAQSDLDYLLINQLYAFAVMLEATTGLTAPDVLSLMLQHRAEPTL